ncbi:Pre-mRNA-splicing factor CWC21 [Podospora conica]|nr:Pre-mRNA-splicing factor CWC21 [Schizothecium conicum]
MSDNVGLSTPRGSGTSGYVQRNLAFQRPRDAASPYTRRPDDIAHQSHRPRAPDQGLLEHDRKREVEVKVFELRDKLEEEGLDEEEIDARCAVLRKQLTSAPGGPGPKRNLKMHMVHELADAKIKESERLRVALKISKDYEEGGHWRRQDAERAAKQGDGPPPLEEGSRGQKARRDWDAPPPRRERRERSS